MNKNVSDTLKMTFDFKLKDGLASTSSYVGALINSMTLYFEINTYLGIVNIVNTFLRCCLRFFQLPVQVR